EHQSVLAAVRRLQILGYDVVIAEVDPAARADPDAIVPGTALVSVGLANNELGSVQPVAEVIQRAHDVGALVHLDACAGPRWMPIPPGADLVSISGHKLGAGRGGLLFVQDGDRIDPLHFRRPQERGRRAGRRRLWRTRVRVRLARPIPRAAGDWPEPGAVARQPPPDDRMVDLRRRRLARYRHPALGLYSRTCECLALWRSSPRASLSA